MEYKWRDESCKIPGYDDARFVLALGAFTVVLVKFNSSPCWDVYAAMGYDKHDHVPMKLLVTFPAHTCEKWAKHDAIKSLYEFLRLEAAKLGTLDLDLL